MSLASAVSKVFWELYPRSQRKGEGKERRESKGEVSTDGKGRTNGEETGGRETKCV